MPQWAGSCWYYLRYLDPANDEEFVDPVNERYWMTGPGPAAPPGGGVDLYVGGVEHAVLHLLYARFWHKVLYDLGYVSSCEPFGRLVNQGYILADAFTDERGMYVPADEVITAADGSARYRNRPVTRRSGKMGKSLKNGVSPDQIYQRYGADTLRLQEMAMGPIEADRAWRPDDIAGVHRFLQRLWRAVVSEQTGLPAVSENLPDEAALRLLQATIAAVRRDFGELRFHTAIARLTELTTAAARIAARDGALPLAIAEPLILMVAPLAPHIAEELWHRLGHGASLAYEPFPEADPALAGEATVPLPVQVNGKTRLVVLVRAGAGRDEVERVLHGDPEFDQLTRGLVIDRVIIVPGRIVNVLTRPVLLNSHPRFAPNSSLFFIHCQRAETWTSTSRPDRAQLRRRRGHHGHRSFRLPGRGAQFGQGRRVRAESHDPRGHVSGPRHPVSPPAREHVL